MELIGSLGDEPLKDHLPVQRGQGAAVRAGVEQNPAHQLVMAAALGPGAALASVPVLLYEAALTLSAGAVSAFLTPPVVNEMTCVGSLIIMAIGFNMLKITDIKVANFLLAPFLPVLLCHFF